MKRALLILFALLLPLAAQTPMRFAPFMVAPAATGGGGGTPPTIVQKWTTNRTASASFTIACTGIAAGARLVICTANSIDNVTCSASGGGLDYAEKIRGVAASSGSLAVFTTTYPAGGTLNVALFWSSGTHAAATIYEITGDETTPAGSTATNYNQSAPSLSITTTRADSLLFMTTCDWNAVTGTRTYRDSATMQYEYPGDGAEYGAYFYTKTATSIGSYTEGMSAPTGQSATTGILEIRKP